VEPVSLIVAALAAGAVKGVGETATAAVRDAYDRLKRLVSARLAGTPSAQVVFARHGEEPDAWQAALADALTESGADTERDVINAARRLVELLDEAGRSSGKYVVDTRGAQGVQVGDHNRQLNQFSSAPPSL
jgi:hypothetical protein